ncbi:TrmB family transcriptional regulator [Candidatus Woesearchaeota archaeon]|nr:TrmB family transcriptional regulator [Candidatus Woesearchaeota archaeon]
MIFQNEFLNKLKDFGLNTYEAKLWTALLSRGVATAGELSDIANVPRSRSYDVLESLERKGFVVLKLGKPIKYVAISPEEVVDRVKKNIQEEALSQAKVIENIKGSDLISELSLLHSNGIKQIDPFEITSAIRGRKNLQAHLNFIIKNAKKEVLLLTTDLSVIQDLKALKSSLFKVNSKGVSIKLLAPISKNNLKLAKDTAPFIEIKQAPSEVSTRFCIVDKEHISFMVPDDSEVHPSYDFGIWVNSPSFIKNFYSFFDYHWKKSK